MLLTCIVPVAALAQERVPAPRQAAILMRALAYERDAPSRAGGHFAIAVLVRADEAASQKAGAEMTTALTALAKLPLQGMPVSVTQVDFASAEALKSAISTAGVDALYVTPGLSAQLPIILQQARAQRVVTMAGEASSVNAGVTLGVVSEDNRPRILVNVKSAAAVGATFSAELLALASVVQ